MAKLKYRVRVLLGDQELVLLVPAAPETTSFTMPQVIVTAPTATPTTHVAVAATVATGRTVTADAILAQPRVADGREGSRLW